LHKLRKTILAGALFLLGCVSYAAEPVTIPTTNPVNSPPDGHLVLEKGRLVVLTDDNEPLKEYTWNDSSCCCEHGENYFSITLNKSGELQFSGSWTDPGFNHYYAIQMIQDVTGKVSANFSCDSGPELAIEESNFEKICLNNHDLKKLLDTYFFNTLDIMDPVDKKWMEIAIDVEEKVVNPDWKAPSGLEGKIKNILLRLDDDNWKVRNKASGELSQLGLDGVIYIKRSISRERLTPEQNCRLDYFISVQLQGYEAKLGDPIVINVPE
jgi:hypothetical protein